MSVIEQQTKETREERTANLLEAAALELEVRGHVKNDLLDDRGRVCMIGAVLVAGGWDGNVLSPVMDTPSFFRFADAFSGYEIEVIWWNNAPERQPEEVAFALRLRAAEIRLGRWSLEDGR